MNARVTLSNGRTIKANGHGIVVIQTTKEKFVVVSEI
jgi:hypothetical protein